MYHKVVRLPNIMG